MTKPVPLRQARLMFDGRPDIHWHKCKCGKQWKHTQSRLGCNYAEAHTCPKCGEDATLIYVKDE